MSTKPHLLDVVLLLCQQPKDLSSKCFKLMDFEKGTIKFNQGKLEENKIPMGSEVSTILSQCVLYHPF